MGIFIAAVLILAGAGSITPTAAAPTVTVPGVGVFVGAVDPLSADDVFAGIRYALPPVGETGRFLPPRAVPRIEDSGAPLPTINATVHGNRCVQSSDAVGSTLEPYSPLSEDCLTLNVITPTDRADDASLPVLVVIHGGSLTQGSSNEMGPLASTFMSYADGAIIIVTLNYRLGLFGFLGGTETRERAGSAAGNFGILDQQLALRWIQENIAAFGGDPDEVTLHGFSAGGYSVRTHLALDSSSDLFKRAIVQAGTAVDEMRMEDADAREQDVLSVANCTDIACLIALDTEDLRSVNRVFSGDNVAYVDAADSAEFLSAPFRITMRNPRPDLLWAPVIDGELVKDTAVNVFRERAAAAAEGPGEGAVKKQVIIGSNADEFASFYMRSNNLTEAEYDDLLRYGGFNETEIEAIKDLYSPERYDYPSSLGEYSQWWWRAMRGATDSIPGLGICAARYSAKAMSASGLDVYMYHLEAPMQTELLPGAGPDTPLAGHAFALFYAFALPFPFFSNSDDLALASVMSAFWLSFITGSAWPEPTSDAPMWPLYTVDGDQVLVFDAPGTFARSGIRSDACSFWEAELAAAERTSSN